MYKHIHIKILAYSNLGYISISTDSTQHRLYFDNTRFYLKKEEETS